MMLRRLPFISVLLLVLGCGCSATDPAADEVGETAITLEAIGATAAPAVHLVTSIEEQMEAQAQGEPVGVDEVQMSDVVLTSSALPDDDIALIARLVVSTWVPVAPDDGDIDIEQRRRRWTFSTKGRSLIIEGFDGCNSFSSFMSPDDEPGRLVDGVLVDFDVATEERGCDGLVLLATPTTGDVLRVVDDGARLEVVRGGIVVVEFRPST